MGKRLKPIGQEWSRFHASWQGSTHDQKVLLAKGYGVTYDTAKHWVSEGATDPKEAVPETPKAEGQDLEEAIGEVLMTRSLISLDFCSFDIETTNLTADFSVLLCAAIKPFGKEAIVFRGDDYADWRKSRANDKEIVKDIGRELSKHAVIMGHYSSGFDMPYMRTKMVRYGLPPLPPMFGVDTWRIAKDNFCLSRRRLETLAQYFQLGDKSAVDGGLWMEAALNGSKVAMDAIVAHNIQDVFLLEKLAGITFPYIKSLRRL